METQNEILEKALTQQQEAEDFAKLRTGISYEKASDKYKDNFSTAITFIFFGIAGIVVLILNFFGILPLFNAKNSSGILINIVFVVLFIIFFGIGIYSYKTAKKAKAVMAEEENYISKATEWMSSNLSCDIIDASYDGSELAEEMKYFNRSEYIKAALKAEFPELRDDIADSLTDNYIEENFNI